LGKESGTKQGQRLRGHALARRGASDTQLNQQSMREPRGTEGGQHRTLQRRDAPSLLSLGRQLGRGQYNTARPVHRPPPQVTLLLLLRPHSFTSPPPPTRRPAAICVQAALLLLLGYSCLPACLPPRLIGCSAHASMLVRFPKSTIR
jgi:hypothetical protein